MFTILFPIPLYRIILSIFDLGLVSPVSHLQCSHDSLITGRTMVPGVKKKEILPE